MQKVKAVFFDIGDTLGQVTVSASGDHIERFDLFSYMIDVLQGLTDAGVRIGIISNRGEVPEAEIHRALQESNIYDFFDQDLITYGPKDSVEIFLEALRKAEQADNSRGCLFVGENVTERNYAAAAGLQVSKHPVEAFALVRSSNASRFRRSGFVAMAGEAALDFANPGSNESAAFDDVLDAIRLHGEELLRFDGVIAVKPGYRFQNGRITTQPAITVTVLRKLGLSDVAMPQLIPRKLGNVIADVVPAMPIEQWRYLERQRIAAQSNLKRPLGEINTLIPGEIGVIEEAAALVKHVEYTPPPDKELIKFDEEMEVVCHSSPDTGWRNLKPFLSGTKHRLTATMYEFNAGYIFDALLNSLKSPHELRLIMDGGSSSVIPSQSKGDVSKDQIRDRLQAELTERFTFAWAAVADDGKTTSSFFPSAYHIKVAVRDSESLWLSSGNWKRSNQPEIDPFNPPDGFKPSSFQRSQSNNREWHVIIHNRNLAGLFETYINHDISQAQPFQKAGAGPTALTPMPDLFVPAPPSDDFAAFAAAQFFKEHIVKRKVQLQPLLTPDNYLDKVLPLIEGAKTRLYFQNQSLSPSASNKRYTKLFRALRDKSKVASIDTKIIVSEFADLSLLVNEGFDMGRVKVQKDCHNKGIIIDDQIVVIGSHNWTGQGATQNRDASLIFHDFEIAKYYNEIFLYDWNTLASFHNAMLNAMPIVALPGEPPPPGMIRRSWHDVLPEGSEVAKL